MKGKRPQPTCDDVPGEFCRRFLSLMASFYDNPSTEEILTFPSPRPQSSTPKEEKKLEFESPVTDLRLRRKLEATASENAEVTGTYNDKMRQLAEEFKTGEADMTGVFEAELAERSEIPKYLAIQKLDEAEERRSKRGDRKPMDILAIEKQNTRRLEIAMQRGIIRAKKRRERMENSATTKEFYKSQIGRNQPTAAELYLRKEVEASLRREVRQSYSPK